MSRFPRLGIQELGGFIYESLDGIDLAYLGRDLRMLVQRAKEGPDNTPGIHTCKLSVVLEEAAG